MMDQLLSKFRRKAPLPSDDIKPTAVGAPLIGLSESKLYSTQMPKYNPDDLIGRKGFRIYKQMLLDEQVKAVTRFKRDAITSRDFVFKIPGEEQESLSAEMEKRVDIYNAMVRDTYGSFSDGLNFIMMAMYQGFSLTEKVFDAFDYKGKPYIGIKKLVPRPFWSFKFNVDEYGEIINVTQQMDNMADERIIDLSRFVYYVQNPEIDYHYGQSELREAYRAWYSKDVIIRLQNIFLEKFAGGFVVGKPTAGTRLTPGTPDYNAMVAAMNSIQTQTSMLLPSNMDVELFHPATTDQFERAIAGHDLAIAKALLVPNLLGITPAAQTGGYAQANTQLEAFLWTLDADAVRLAEVLNEQIFIPLNKINFADGVGPLFHFKPVSETKKFELIKTWKELVSVNAVEASETDEAYLRELLDMPEKGEPLEVNQPAGADTSVIPGTKTRKPVADTNTKGRVVHEAAFSRAERRVSTVVIGKKADTIEEEGAVAVELRLAEMVDELVGRIKQQRLGTPAAGIQGINAIDFNVKRKTKVRKAIDAMLTQAWDLGKQHAATELNKAKQSQIKLSMERISDEAAAFLATNGFRMFGNLSDDMRAIIQNILVNGVKFGWSSDQIAFKVYDELVAAGFMSAAVGATISGRSVDNLLEAIGATKADAHRIYTAVRTNVFEAINEARWSYFTDPELGDFIEGFEYSAIMDSRTTEVCRHMDDRAYPKDSPIWNQYRPPNHFNCRSILVPITAIDVEVAAVKDRGAGRWSNPPTIKPQRGFG